MDNVAHIVGIWIFSILSWLMCSIDKAWFPCLLSYLDLTHVLVLLFCCWISTFVYLFTYHDKSLLFYCSPNSTNFHEYTLPEDVQSVVPSGVNYGSKNATSWSCEDNVMLISSYISLSTNIGHFIASGFMMHVKYIQAGGYPKPPPLMLESTSLLSIVLTYTFCNLF